MIVISEASRDDNFLSVSQESPKTAAYKEPDLAFNPQ